MVETEHDINTKEGRMVDIDQSHQGLQTIMEERAAAYADDPYGRTGLFNRTFKIRGTREHPVIFEQYTLDHRLLRERSKLRKEASILARHFEKRGKAPGQVSLEELMLKIQQGNERVAKCRAEREARKTAEREKQTEPANGERGCTDSNPGSGELHNA